MATLTPGRPVTVATPELLVENQLAPGAHRFQLVVIDEAGLESLPFELVVTVRPTRPRGPTGPVIRRDDIIPDIGRATDLIRPIRRPQRPQ